MRAIALMLVILALLPIIVLKPHVGILAWAWLGYMNPQNYTWGITRTIGLAQIVAIVFLISWLMSKEPKRIILTPVTVLLIIFTLWMGVTTVFALSPEAARFKLIEVLKVMLMTFVTLPVFQSKSRLNSLIWVITLSVGFFGIKGGIFVILTGGNYAVYGPGDATIGSNNDIGVALIMILPLMRYLQLQSENFWVRMGLYGAMPLVLLSIFATYSRGAALAAVVTCFVLWLKTRYKIVTGALGVAVLIVGVAVMPQQWYDRIESIGSYEQDNSALSRLTLWRYAVSVATARPIVGGGFEIFPDTTLYSRFGLRLCERGEMERDCLLKARSAHSNYFGILGEHGFVGLGLYLAIGLLSLLNGTWVLRRARGRPDLGWARDLAAMLQVSMIGYAVGGVFINRGYFDLYYHLVVIMVLVRFLVERALADEKEQSAIADPPVAVAAGPGREPAAILRAGR